MAARGLSTVSECRIRMCDTYQVISGGLHPSDRDPDWHFTVAIKLDRVYKIHVHASLEEVRNSKSLSQHKINVRADSDRDRAVLMEN